MATSILEAFVVTFGLDARGYKKGADEVGTLTKRTRDEAKKGFGEIEDSGKKAADAFRSVGSQLTGLFLAFQGASSMTGFFKGMMDGAANAQQFGQTIDMAADKVMAWQRLMKDVGGSEGDANGGLAAMNALKQDMKMGRIAPDTWKTLGLLGVGAGDIKDKNPEELLLQLSKAARPWGNSTYSDQISKLGLPQGMVQLLTSKGGGLEKRLREIEADSEGFKKLADESIRLRTAFSSLSDTIQKLTTGPLADFMEGLDDILNGKMPKSRNGAIPTAAGVAAGAAVGFASPIPGGALIGGIVGGLAANKGWHAAMDHWWPQNGTAAATPGGAPGPKGGDGITNWLVNHGVGTETALGIRAGIHAEGNGAYNKKSGAFGIGQWLGPRKAALFARFGPNPNLEQQLQFLLWELMGGDHGGKSVLKAGGRASALHAYITNFMRPQGKNWEHRKDWLGDINRGHAYLARTGGMNVGTMNFNVKSTDPKGAAREIHHTLKGRGHAALADRKVNA